MHTASSSTDFYPWYAPAGLWRGGVRIDESNNNEPIFVMRHDNVDIEYNYDKNTAQCKCYKIKSKNKLKKIRQKCKRFIELIARNESELTMEDFQSFTDIFFSLEYKQ